MYCLSSPSIPCAIVQRGGSQCVFLSKVLYLVSDCEVLVGSKPPQTLEFILACALNAKSCLSVRRTNSIFIEEGFCVHSLILDVILPNLSGRLRNWFVFWCMCCWTLAGSASRQRV